MSMKISEMELSHIDKDIERYERVKQRALALGFKEYASLVLDVLLALRMLKELDDIGGKR